MNGQLADFIIELGTDSTKLDRFREDPDAMLDAAGITAEYQRAILKRGQSSWIRSLVSSDRSVPAPSEIEARVAARLVDDPSFAAQLLAEPRLTVERVLSAKLPTTYVVEVDAEAQTEPALRVIERAGALADEHNNPPPPPPVNVDIDIDVVVDVDVDIDVDIDAIVVVDVDVDIDIDVDTDTVEVTQTGTEAMETSGRPLAHSRRPEYWTEKRRIWREAGSHREGATTSTR